MTTSADYRALIAGELVGASDGATLDCINPATEQVVGTIPACTPGDVDAAVSAASAAAPAWRDRGWAGRSEALFELARVLDQHREEFATLDAIDSGNPITAMRRDAKNATSNLRYFAGLAPEIKGETLESGVSSVNMSVREPWGVVGRIIPFNHPFQFVAAKVAAPLAAGNTVVIKPSEHTSMSALRMAEIVQEILPAGVLNIVTGNGASTGAALAAHPDVPRVSFTGGVPTGQHILRAAAKYMKEVTLELGGKNPMIVFPDVDPVAAAKAAIASMNIRRSQGQSCGSTSRVFVHASIHDAFLAAIAAQLGAIKIGDPLADETEMGPLAFRAHYERVVGFLDSAQQDGARFVTGGSRPTGLDTGYFVAPTVLADVDPAWKVAREEIFGPVMCVFPWTDEDAVVAAANDTDFGLTANVWTNDLGAAHRTARRLEAGYVWINGAGGRPLGGAFGGFKLSGIGKEGGLEELLSYTRGKNINVNFPPN